MTTLLVLVENLNDYLPILEDGGFSLIRAQTPERRAQVIAEQGGQIDAVVTRGPLGLFAEEMDAMPNLRLICVSGAGYEKVDVAAAQARGILVSNGAGVNAPTVADHAMALLLAMVRDIPQADASVRRSEWRKVMCPSFAGKRLGILGLGAVGLEIARRAEAFGMHIDYHNRRPRQDLAYRWQPSVRELAEAADFLVLATPGGAATHHLVDAEVLQALGTQGYLVNVARASVVDTQALLAALQAGQIAGAALDVFDDEPQVPDAFKALANVVLTPHVAGLSPEASGDSVRLVRDNLLAFFAGRPLLTPVAAE
ncbi:2-hydroxyacid dehydrogenase [Pseudomonas sp. DTU_2021_1001937_2_SI_NGA_ILE_001]|uniref:2-hydroxyacid dehydrogenase n=1 Tax=Pseudomonas sp. DTU_2021_1001937_2_SI_NGA_ILE_001 TaxID=3077589 RepID=UPI0025CFCD49|nr:2-hydroxyacid dehydrogenase [Pseudomonas sp. DTU_2021_1001937_2_SI_NGA_ILE_001]WNW09636.1 2-hydroxyacid dehydrogenase [Pseudomonas sp. DTU_2021_1001937_2_SI_NGA_ILE_001]